ncbi:P-loop containing nucleoside triphosphate hydrolase protein [Dactylonectria macrodidyma]|uniref:P-loop containing nucleoside triphosphate hydrolase protein n=1 Tax=Dactylonectria macrodidyma TaxID=307937 RepID=A0A9P9FK64_9HYPO|nr:P-loop containing nucleoside triphosphate hydrolase protein [Dactylonectria macrodidyma]
MEADTTGSKGEHEGKGRRPQRGRRSDPKFAAKWLSRLAGLPDEAVLPPEYPDEKMMVVSGYVIFLHVVREAMRRRPRGNVILDSSIAEFHGGMSLNDRSEIVRQFNTESGPKIILLSAVSGGTGLNLSAASHIIICEPFSAPELRNQVISCAHRMPQTKNARVYDMIAGLSEIYYLKMTSAKKKQGFADEVNLFFIRHDCISCAMSEVPSREDLKD